MAVQAAEALKAANAAAEALRKELSPDQPVPDSDDDIQLEWDVVHRALHARANAGGNGTIRPAPRKTEQADEPIRLSHKEILQLLPFLDKSQKKKLQQ